MANTIIRPKSHDEWLKVRESGIGSSEVSTILGINPFETPYQLYLRKKGMMPAKEENFAMRAGHYLEDAVSRFYSDKTGVQIIKSSAVDWIIRDNDRPYLQVSPDRTFWIPGLPKNKHNKAILECKTTQLEVDELDVPQHWYIQLQYQLGVAGYTQGALAWLTKGREFGSRDFAFDADIYAWITDEVQRFWTDYICGDLVPESINVDDIMLRNPRHRDGKYIEADDELQRECEQLKELKEMLDIKNKEKKEIEERIKLKMGDAEAIVMPGTTNFLATWRSSKSSTKFDEKRFQKENAELYRTYTYEASGSRRFLLK